MVTLGPHPLSDAEYRALLEACGPALDGRGGGLLRADPTSVRQLVEAGFAEPLGEPGLARVTLVGRAALAFPLGAGEHAMVLVDEVKVWSHARPPFHEGSCHLTVTGAADPARLVECLHAFAGRLGLRREWFQSRSRVAHYDLTPRGRELSIGLGARPVSAREQARARRAARLER